MDEKPKLPAGLKLMSTKLKPFSTTDELKEGLS
jgi:hypothetical protein